VGVDVEEVKPIEPEVADTHFSASELSDLSGLQGDAWLSGFYRCWTRKEAILKAEGVGLHRALDSFDRQPASDLDPLIVNPATEQLLGSKLAQIELRARATEGSFQRIPVTEGLMRNLPVLGSQSNSANRPTVSPCFLSWQAISKTTRPPEECPAKL
jgi:hypothetical protein